jgi:uncharacterized protein (TIGR03083 family)
MTVDPYVTCPLAVSTYIESVRSDAATLADLGRVEPLTTPIATCGEWTLRELLRHVGFVHRWATHAIADAAAPDRASVPMPADETSDSLVSWFIEGANGISEALATLPTDAPTWHPFPAPLVGAVWVRRMAHETMVHRLDAELAAGRTPFVDPALASDGIDEYLSLIVPHLVRQGRVDLPTSSLHLHCTDVAGEWLVTNIDGLGLVREHAKGDAAVRGPAGAILAELWGRRAALGQCDIVGDTSAADAWLAIGGN